jgi:hypothetical protein
MQNLGLCSRVQAFYANHLAPSFCFFLLLAHLASLLFYIIINIRLDYYPSPTTNTVHDRLSIRLDHTLFTKAIIVTSFRKTEVYFLTALLLSSLPLSLALSLTH